MRTRERMNKDNAHLRRAVGGDSQFMGSHGIKKVRTAFPRDIPEWTQNDEEVRQFLRRKFPVLGMSNTPSWHVMMLRILMMPRRERERAQHQINRAVHMYAVLLLIYRLRLTEQEAAEEIAYAFLKRNRKNERDAVKDALKIIRRHRPE